MKRGAKPPDPVPKPGGGLKIKLKRRDSAGGAAGQKGPGGTTDAPPVLDIKELELKRKETFEALRKCEVQVRRWAAAGTCSGASSGAATGLGRHERERCMGRLTRALRTPDATTFAPRCPAPAHGPDFQARIAVL